MKKLSDYKDNDAIELWADIIEPLSGIMSDEKVSKMFSEKGKTLGAVAKVILHEHADEVRQVLLAIDDTPLDGVNTIIRLVGLLTDLMSREEFKGFFKSAEPVKTE